MTYAESLEYLAFLGHELHGVEFRLETTYTILAVLGNPHLKCPTAIIAGTNGKGSTSAMLASILRQAGYRTGLYTSPHLIRINERIAVDGAEISDEEFARALSSVKDAVERLLADKSLEKRPSFFEVVTAVAFLHLAQAQVDFAVLEVGMGGRLDATNVTEPRVAVITNIELDHQEFLGATHAAIAREKAGVIKPGRPVISGCAHPEAAAVIRQRCAELGAPLIETRTLGQFLNLRNSQGRYEFDYALNGDLFSNLISPLLGQFQVDNVAAAVAAAWQLRAQGFAIDQTAIDAGLRLASWPGRLDTICDQPLVLLDGAHNPAGAREVARFVRECLAGRKLRLVFASMRDKSFAEMSEMLFPLAAEVYLTRPPHPRAASPEEVLAAAPRKPDRPIIEPDPERALSRAVEASSPDDVVLVAGSLFLVGAIKKTIRSGGLHVLKSPGSGARA